MKKYGVFISLGLELTALVFVATWIGSWLEKKYPSEGLIIVGLLFLAFTAWTLRMVLGLRKFAKDKENKN
ncbi:MAG: AtpZ/AtpI family protein [Bdellovibrionales bacterium]